MPNTEAELKIDDPYIRYLNGRELSRILNKSEPTLYRLRRARIIPYVRIGGEIRYRLSEVERALSKFTVHEVSL
jgi:excisionase family DNA binding protein